jgi:hypothetical protein
MRPPLFLIPLLLFCLHADAILWSTLGVVADGCTDNTPALNALPPGVPIEGDCPQGADILAQGVWYLRSQLYLRVQAGCRVLSNATGVGSYAISQLDPSQPLSNVTLIGLTVAKTSQLAGDRILLAYIDNFQLLNWTFHHHGGAMFLRGSCQEVAGGSSFDAAPEVGSPGIRHIGNLPKAACLRPQPANVWVHHNSIASGDGAYQACQPLANALWAGVGSDDLLFEANTGASTASAFILVGLHNVPPQHSSFTCSNMTFQDMQGSGLRLIYVQAASAPNLVTRLLLRNLQLRATPHLSYTPASIQVTAVWGGAVRGVLMDGIHALGTLQVALNETGLLEGVVFTNGVLAAPAVGGSGPTVSIEGGAFAVLSNSFIGAPLAGDGISLALQSAAQGTQVLNCTLAGVGVNRVGIALGSANGSVVLGNTFSPQQGAPRTTGIALGAATSYAAVHLNDVRAMATGIVCGRGSGNSVSNNPGAADC